MEDTRGQDTGLNDPADNRSYAKGPVAVEH